MVCWAWRQAETQRKSLVINAYSLGEEVWWSDGTRKRQRDILVPLMARFTHLKDLTLVGDVPCVVNAVAPISLTALSFHHGSLNNKQLKAVLKAIGQKLRKLSLSCSEGISENLFRDVPIGTNLQDGAWIRGAIWQLAPKLTCLHLDGCNINNDVCRHIARLSLTNLDLSCTKVGDAGVVALSEGPAGQSLKVLRLGATKVKTMEGLHMPQLTYLDLGASGVHQYRGVRKPRQLEVFICHHRMAPPAVEHIAGGCPSLTHLNLSSVISLKNSTSVGGLQTLGGLCVLSLADSSLPEGVILRVLSGRQAPPLPHLRSLNLSKTKAGDATCIAIAACCPDLHTLLLAHTALGPAACCLLLGTGEDGLCQLPVLHTLSCYGTKVDDASQGAWLTPNRIKWLDLGKTKVSVETCCALAQIPEGQLRALSLGGIKEAHAGVLKHLVAPGSRCLFNLVGGSAMITMANGVAGSEKEGTIAAEYEYVPSTSAAGNGRRRGSRTVYHSRLVAGE